MGKRTEAGQELTIRDTLPGTKVVGLDIIGKVAKVSRGDVVRVLAALATITRATGLTVEELTDWDSVPLAHANTRRSAQVDAIYPHIVEKEANSAEGMFLRLGRRGDF